MGVCEACPRHSQRGDITEKPDVLDDAVKISELDGEDMLSSIMSLPEHIVRGMQGNRIDIPYFKPENIVACGMGGSAIAGEIASAWLSERLFIPFVENRNYDIPSFVSEKTLVLALSYSGNTYETLNMVREALNRKAVVVAISSGGKLREIMEEEGGYFIEVPEGLQPRAALGYLISAIGSVMKSLKIYDPEVELLNVGALLKKMRKKLNPSVPLNENEAKKISVELKDTIPVIYSYGPYVSAANRWHTQINENSKMLAFYGALTEMDHNEIVGWKDKADGFSAVFLRVDENEILRTVTDFNKKTIKAAGGKTVDIEAEGESTLEKIMSLIYMGDFVSYYLAILRGIDPTPVDVITELKGNVRKVL